MQAQAWLRLKDYRPATLRIGALTRLGGRMTMRAVPPKGVQVQFRLPVAGNDESP